ncbi:MAG: type VI secretion system Vgr family protein [Sulfuriferula sp.]
MDDAYFFSKPTIPLTTSHTLNIRISLIATMQRLSYANAGLIQLKMTQSGTELNLGNLVRTTDNDRSSFCGNDIELRTDTQSLAAAGLTRFLESHMACTYHAV